MLALAAIAAAPARAQSLYSPAEGDFEIAFPSQPTIQSKPANRSKDIAARRYVVEEPSREMIVAIDDYPQGDLPAAANGGVYDKFLRIRADNEDAQLVSTRPARLSGRPCLEGSIQAKGAVEIVRILMDGDRVWELTYALPEGADPAGADAAFFSSFRIRKAP
jgi:hypothetical protein